jgi:hypothetical protein
LLPLFWLKKKCLTAGYNADYPDAAAMTTKQLAAALVNYNLPYVES